MSSKTKNLQKAMVRRIVVLENNMMQWAIVDVHLGKEQFLRASQVKAIQDGDVDEAVAIHNQRIECVEKALEELRHCPACGTGEEHGEG